MEWHVWDFPDTLYIKLSEDFRKELCDRLVNKFGSRNKASIFLGINTTTLKRGLQTGIDSEGFEAYTSMKLIKKILDIFPEDKEAIERNVIAYRARSGNSITNPILPLRETPEMYSIIAHMICDGSAGERKSPVYYNSCRELLEEFKNYLTTFGEMRTNEYLVHSKVLPVYGILFPKAITDILSHVFQIKFVRTEHLPKKVFSTTEECKYAFIRALFDDEGTFSSKQRQLVFIQKEYGIVRDIKKLFDSIEIRTGYISKVDRDIGILHSITVLSQSRVKFKTVINFTHPEKRRILEYVVKNDMERKNYVTLKTKIIQMFEQQNSLSRLEITNRLKSNINSVTEILYEFRKEGIIESNFNGKNKPYIWSKAKVCVS
ncbi:MAG: hypothetical protein ABIA21_02470 [Candidatus Aenigmatarchaeota archaeon]